MTIEEQLIAAHARYPRGLPLGFKVEYATPSGGRTYITLAAFQEWRARNRSAEIVGLVWVSPCAGCQQPARQLTGNRPATLATMCEKCDVVGSRGATFDTAVAEAILPYAEGVVLPKIRGRVEGHVLEVIATFDPDMKTIQHEDLVAAAAKLLAPPQPGKRDTRRQHVVRAIDNLCREKDGEISRSGNTIVLYPRA